MKSIVLMTLIGALALAAPAIAAENPAEVDAVVAAVKAKNPEVCKGGQSGVTDAVREQTRALATAGKIKGNPQAVGAEAGQKLAKECTGG